MVSSQPVEVPERQGLLRVIRRWDLVALAVNTIIGAGIFGLPAEVFKRVGVYSLFAFVACALVVVLMVLCFAEVSSRFTGTGGPYIYAREAFGPVAGFEVGWLLWIARLTAFAANLNLFVSYLAFFWPGASSGAGRIAVILLVIGALTALNLTGVRNATSASNVFTVAKLLPLLLLIGAGLFVIQGDSYTLPAWPGIGDFSIAVLLLVFAFSGFELATIAGGEARNPRGDIPKALLIAIAIVAVCYILIQLVVVGTLPADALAASARPLADAGSRILGPWGGGLISAGALVSIGGNLLVIILVAPRLLFAMSERRELPEWVGAVHPRFRTPHAAILVTSSVMLVLALTGTFVYAATISVIARLLAYGSTCAALPVLRRKKTAPEAAFHTPGGDVLAVLSVVVAGYLLSRTTLAQARDGAIAVAIGLIVYWLGKRKP